MVRGRWVDGYAVVAEDTFGASRHEPRTLRRIETVHTGNVPTRRWRAGNVPRSRRVRQCPKAATPLSWSRRRIAVRTARSRSSHRLPRQHVGRRGADIAARQVVLGCRRRAHSKPVGRRRGADHAIDAGMPVPRRQEFRVFDAAWLNARAYIICWPGTIKLDRRRALFPGRAILSVSETQPETGSRARPRD